jgi:hypothetical protein
MRRYRLFSGSVAVLAVLLTSGCFYSDKPLLARSEYVQPIRGGLWESLAPVATAEWRTMSKAERTANHCRTINSKPYCGERVRITALPDKGYQLRDDGKDDFDAFQLARLSGDDFIAQQLHDDGSAEYALATTIGADQFALRLPTCSRDTFLHVYAPPAEPGSSKCLVADRARLGKLFNDYRAKPLLGEEKVYRRIGD